MFFCFMSYPIDYKGLKPLGFVWLGTGFRKFADVLTTSLTRRDWKQRASQTAPTELCRRSSAAYRPGRKAKGILKGTAGTGNSDISYITW